jgi:hypothetical protein
VRLRQFALAGALLTQHKHRLDAHANPLEVTGVVKDYHVLHQNAILQYAYCMTHTCSEKPIYRIRMPGTIIFGCDKIAPEYHLSMAS